MPDQNTINPAPATAAGSSHHHWVEDVHALLSGAVLMAVGVSLLTHAGLVSGGAVGLALVLGYATGWNMAWIFFCINLPFYGLGLRTLGWPFTLKTFVTVALVAALSSVLPLVLRYAYVDPWAAAVIGGLLCGVSLLALLRHQCSLGGLVIVAQWLQHKHGWRAGKVLMAFDVLIVLLAMTQVSGIKLLQSLVGALMVGLVLAFNHKPRRYLGM